jgi:hypothetical protein
MVPADFDNWYPAGALLIAVIVYDHPGRGAGMTRKHLTMAIEPGLPPVAGIILTSRRAPSRSRWTAVSARCWWPRAPTSRSSCRLILAVLIRGHRFSDRRYNYGLIKIIGPVEGMSTGQVSRWCRCRRRSLFFPRQRRRILAGREYGMTWGSPLSRGR